MKRVCKYIYIYQSIYIYVDIFKHIYLYIHGYGYGSIIRQKQARRPWAQQNKVLHKDKTQVNGQPSTLPYLHIHTYIHSKSCVVHKGS